LFAVVRFVVISSPWMVLVEGVAGGSVGESGDAVVFDGVDD
jgi:hypothetical protein